MAVERSRAAPARHHGIHVEGRNEVMMHVDMRSSGGSLRAPGIAANRRAHCTEPHRSEPLASRFRRFGLEEAAGSPQQPQKRRGRARRELALMLFLAGLVNVGRRRFRRAWTIVTRVSEECSNA